MLKTWKITDQLPIWSSCPKPLNVQLPYRYSLTLKKTSWMLPCNLHAYRRNHSVETALLGVSNDLLLTIDKGLEAVLLMLDYSAAFDIIMSWYLTPSASYQIWILWNCTSVAWILRHWSLSVCCHPRSGISQLSAATTWGSTGLSVGPHSVHYVFITSGRYNHLFWIWSCNLCRWYSTLRDRKTWWLASDYSKTRGMLACNSWLVFSKWSLNEWRKNWITSYMFTL